MIQLTADSTCDLGESIAKHDIGIMPLSVILGENAYRDGVDIMPKDIFAYVEKTGQLPKTAAPSIGDYEDYFAPYVDRGDTVIHFSISAKASSANSYAEAAAKRFPGKVYVVDSKALSTGQGLLILKAADLREAGKSAEEIVNEVNALRPLVNTSFVPDRLDYLYKGGRCSRLAFYGANILKIHPLIEMEDGQLVPGKKYRGSMVRCIEQYIEDLAVKYPAYETRRCFITHSNADEEVVEAARKKVAKLFHFEEVLETVAGSVITGHCGRNTLGVLFIAKQGEGV